MIFYIPSIPLMPGYYKTKNEILNNSSFPTNKNEASYLGTTYDPSKDKVDHTWRFIYKVNTETDYTLVSRYIIPKNGYRYVVSSSRNLYQYVQDNTAKNVEFPAGVIGYVQKINDNISIKFILDGDAKEFFPWQQFHKGSTLPTNVTFDNLVTSDSSPVPCNFVPSEVFANNSAYYNWSEDDAEKFNDAIRDFVYLWYPSSSSSDDENYHLLTDNSITHWYYFGDQRRMTSLGNKNAEGHRNITARALYSSDYMGIATKLDSSSVTGYEYKTAGQNINSGPLASMLTENNNVNIGSRGFWMASDDILRANMTFLWSHIMTSYLNSTNNGTIDAISIVYSDEVGWASNWKAYAFSNVNYFPFEGAAECGADTFDDVVCTNNDMRFSANFGNFVVEGITSLCIHGRHWPDNKYRYYCFGLTHVNGGTYISTPDIIYYVEPKSVNYTVRSWNNETYTESKVNQTFNSWIAPTTP